MYRLRHLWGSTVFRVRNVLTWWSDGTEFGVVLQEVLVQLGLDVLAVGVLPQRGTVRPRMFLIKN